MKPIRSVLLMVLILGVLQLLSGCAPKGTVEINHYVDLYVNEDLKYVTLENDKPIENFMVFPGDIVIINNLTKDKVVVEVPRGMFESSNELFEKGAATSLYDQLTIEGHKRVILKVLKEGTAAGSFRSTKLDHTIEGTPTAKVGEEP